MKRERSAGMSDMSKGEVRNTAGFSLVEMLLVIAIIGVLLALLLPALSDARNSALQIRTTAMCTDLTNAAQRFGNDNSGRNPGYFTERQMGSSSNWASGSTPLSGMSAMENAMLELGGTEVVLGRADDPDVSGLVDEDRGIIEIGPGINVGDRVVVNINKIGAAGAYFTPDKKFFKAQGHGLPLQAQAGNRLTLGEGQELMPDVLDAWGRPMLVWAQDPMARGEILVEPNADQTVVYEQFAQIDSDAGAAWFYLASNAAFLEARGFDDGNINMAANLNTNPDLGRTSAIGGGVEDAERIRTLATVLASPGSYIVDPALPGIDSASYDQIFPSRPRGRFIVHSAGRDGQFLSSADNGWRSNAHTDGPEFRLDFGNNFFNHSNARLTDRSGAASSVDMIDDFDDIMVGTK